jgi:hypothetical protein
MLEYRDVKVHFVVQNAQNSVACSALQTEHSRALSSTDRQQQLLQVDQQHEFPCQDPTKTLKVSAWVLK